MVATAVALVASLPAAFAGNGNGKGKPGGGGEDPPTPAASIEYELTWLAGFGGDDTFVYDVNSAGIAVGRSEDANGTFKGFVATAAAGMVDFDNWLQLPAGWTSRVLALNESNLACGYIKRPEFSDNVTFLVDLADSTSLELLHSFPAAPTLGMRINENGDFSFRVDGVNYLYVRASDQLFSLDGIADLQRPHAINEQLQLALPSNDDRHNRPGAHAFRYSFDSTTETGFLEDLQADLKGNALTFAFDITNEGTVYGSFLRKGGLTKAGYVENGSTVWNALEAVDSRGDACAHGANESGQIIGANDAEYPYGGGSDLWILDPVEGFFSLDELITGDPAEVLFFQTMEGFHRPVISEAESATGYGVIAGYGYEVDTTPGTTPKLGFILTPRPVQP
jgi:hypothetical protein